MNSFQFVETAGICIIIAIQLYIFFKTKTKIATFKSIFPGSEHFEIVTIALLKHYFELHPKDILANLVTYTQASAPQTIYPETSASHADFIFGPSKQANDERIFTELINKKKGGNFVTDKIIYALNTYLLRNKGVAADFLLIKDVVERNTDAVENDIDQSISIPLYLGLLGTFLGIIFGLWQINFSADQTLLDNAVPLLLGGVKIAMIASFTGLLLTILNSGYYFKGAKVLVEDKKNDFYTFVQIELLPLLNQNINSTLFSLQSNLHKFNEEFKENVGMLGSAIGKNHDALIAQEKILTTLDNIDINEFAKANVTVLRELKLSTDQFSQFNNYLGAVTGMLDHTKDFTARLNQMIERTDNFHELGKQIVTTFEENQALTKFLQNHYNSLDESHQLITQSVNSVNNTLDESLSKLKEFTQLRIIEIQKISLRELDMMQDQYAEKWKELKNLGHLETLDKNLQDMKTTSAGQLASMANDMKAFSDKLSRAITELEAIKKNSTESFLGKLFRKKGKDG